MEGPKVHRLLLPSERVPAEEVLRATHVGITSQSCPGIRELADQIQSYLKGEAVHFRLSLVDLGECSEFQKRVLLAEYEVPRGWVSTYGRIARNLGAPNAARAVGTALARNPFPIIIPCHRTIRSNGDLGRIRRRPQHEAGAARTRRSGVLNNGEGAHQQVLLLNPRRSGCCGHGFPDRQA